MSNGTDNVTSVEKKEKFKDTLNALTELEEVVERLESLTNKLCGQIPNPESPDKRSEVDCVARLLSDTPNRITCINAEICTCIDRLRSELD